MAYLKTTTDDYSNIVQMMEFVLDGKYNIAGKGEKTVYQDFLLFPHSFHSSKSEFNNFGLQVLSIWTSWKFCHSVTELQS